MVISEKGMSNVMAKDTISSKIITIGELMYRVYPYTDLEDLEYGNAYTFGGTFNGQRFVHPYVFPYLGEWSKKKTEVGIYIDKKANKLVTIYPKTDKERSSYSSRRIFIFSVASDEVMTELNKYLTEVPVEELKSGGNIFEPIIKDGDDSGIKAVRLALIAKQIDITPYLNRKSKTWDRANIRKALEKSDTLSFYKLNEYAEMFDMNYGIILFDKDSARDPISKSGKAMVVFNTEHYDITDENIEVIGSIEDLDKLK